MLCSEVFQAAIFSTLIPSSNFTPSITSASQFDPPIPNPGRPDGNIADSCLDRGQRLPFCRNWLSKSSWPGRGGLVFSPVMNEHVPHFQEQYVCSDFSADPFRGIQPGEMTLY